MTVLLNRGGGDISTPTHTLAQGISVGHMMVKWDYIIHTYQIFALRVMSHSFFFFFFFPNTLAHVMTHMTNSRLMNHSFTSEETSPQQGLNTWDFPAVVSELKKPLGWTVKWTKNKSSCPTFQVLKTFLTALIIAIRDLGFSKLSLKVFTLHVTKTFRHVKGYFYEFNYTKELFQLNGRKVNCGAVYTRTFPDDNG